MSTNDWRDHLEEIKQPAQLPAWRIRGTNVEVSDVLLLLQQGWSRERILARFPKLTAEDVSACVGYALEMVQSEKLRAFLQAGIDDIEAGRVVDNDEVWRQFEEKYGPLDEDDA